MRRNELNNIEDALVESILDASEAQIRAEITEAGFDPDSCIADVDKTIASAKAECTRKRLTLARTELAAWRKHIGELDTNSIETARQRLNQLRSGDDELDKRMMMAARKGEGLSDSDLEGLLEDFAALEHLERGEKDE